MNATLTYLRNAPWCRRRGIARALLLVCACAGLALGTSAQAQIAFRSAAQANSAAGATGGGVISFVAAGAQTVGTGASITPVIPAGTAANDFAVLIVAGRPTDTSNPAAPAGWTVRSSSLFLVGANDLKILTYYRVLAGGDANPTINLPAGWQGATAGMSGQIAVWRGVDTTTPFDVADVTGDSGGPIRDWTPPGITTVSAFAWAVSAVATSDTNNITVRTANGFTGRMTGTNYDTTTGGRHAIALADEPQATPGAVTPMIEWRESSNQSDPYVSITFALRPSPPTLSTLVINVPAGTTTGDVMIASVTVRPCSIAALPCTVTITADAAWTLVDSQLQPGGGGTGGNGNQLLVYSRVVTGAEPASYAWTFGGAPVHAGAAGGILTFSGVDTANPIVSDLGALTASSSSHTAPQIDTGTVTNTMLVSTHSSNSSTTWAFPVGMTERVDVSSLTPTDDLGLAIEMNTELRAAAGLTGTTRTAAYTTPGTPANDTGATHLLALRPGSTVNHFSITHAGSGVACDTHTITITAHDAAHNPVNAGGVTISLSTTNSRGSWTGIIAGGGALSDPTPGDGAASYTFAAGSSSVQLSFRYANLSATSESFGFNVSGGGFTESSGTATAADDPSFTMAQAGFRFRNIEDGNSTILTQISGKPSNTGFNARTLRLQAIRTDTATGACTGLFASQTRTVDLGAECNGPAACAGQLASVNGTNIATSNDNGGTGASAYTGISLTFNASSEAATVIAYPDAGQLSLHARYDLDASVAGFEMTGSSNPFVVRPFGLTFPGVAHSNLPTGSVLAAAGDNFSLTVSAYRWAAGQDANNDGIPDTGVNITGNGGVPNFAATATVGQSANLPGVAPGAMSRGANCLSLATIALSAGTATANDWCYSEAGNVILTANVTNYITAGVDITGQSGFDGGGSGGYVGRFRPKRFALDTSVPNAPILTNRAALLPCGSTFSYMGEGMRLTLRLQAQNTQGATTQNYNGAYAMLSPASAAVFVFGARSGATDLTSRLSASYPGVVPAWAGGVLSIPLSDPVFVTVGRRAAPDNPDGPFTVTQLGIAPVDSDTVAMNTLDFDADGNAVNERKNLGVSSEVRFGRLAVRNANGSQLVPLPVQVEAQYWNGSFFITNTQDSCTAIAPANITMGNYTSNLGGSPACETAISSGGTLSAGRRTLRLAAPGSGNNGSVDLTVNLGAAPAGNTCTTLLGAPVPATAANLPYLQGRWDAVDQGADGLVFDDSPTARATFGVYQGSEEVIFVRENF